MRRILAPDADLPLHAATTCRAIEREAQIALPPHTLMRRAGAAVARLALALAPHARRIWIAAGPGNNGGDGFEAALHLHRAGKAVSVTLAGDADRLPPDARDAWERARGAGVVITPAMDADADAANAVAAALGPNDLAIDALLGLGVNRPPGGAVAALIDVLNALRCPVLAVDLPSGLDADTGQPAGGAPPPAPPPRCVRASHTLALLAAKPGLHTGSGRELAGEIWFDDLGVVPAHPPDAWLVGAGHAAAARPARRHAAHKGTYGDVAVVGGAAGMSGAALLAARAAHAAGAGRVWLGPLDALPLALDPVRPELMWRDGWWRDSDAATLARTVVVCGCGGGPKVGEALPRLLDETRRLVLDADALNAVAADTALRQRLAARAARGAATVLTPHPLEAARLLGTSAAAVQADRLAAARALADRDGCIVVLKGSGTVIAAPGRAPFVNPTGNAALATAGTGDVLAGWLGGLWARQPVNAPAADAALEPALAAVHTHGAAADRSRVAPLRAADLAEAMLTAAARLPGETACDLS